MEIGVIFCSCAGQITEKIIFEKFERLIKNQISWIEKFDLACSEEASPYLINLLREKKPEGLIILACSPWNKGDFFKNLASASGLNPYMVNIVNIREHVAWVTEDKDKALKKAYRLFESTLKRIKKQKPLKDLKFSICSDVLIVGAGITGIKAALVLSKAGRKVYLIEKEKFLGGKAVKYEKLFPDLKCGPCIIHPMVEEVINSKNIELINNTEIKEIKGFYGNFLIKTLSKPNYINLKKCIGCSSCEDACPEKAIKVNPMVLPSVADIDTHKCLRFKNIDCDICLRACPVSGAIDFNSSFKEETFNAGAVIWANGFRLFDCKAIPQLGYGKIKDIYTSLEFEEILNSEGPTKGEILTKDGKEPERIAILHCVGSLEEKYYSYCSKICCQYAFKFNRVIRQSLPNTEIIHFVKEIVLPGKKAYNLYNQSIKDPLVKIYRYKCIDELKIEKKQSIVVSFNDNKINCDMLILCPAIVSEENILNSNIHGIYLAGSAKEAMSIEESMNDALSVTGVIFSELRSDDKIIRDPRIAKIDYNKCNSCGICVPVCPFKAIELVNGRVEILNILCEGCGICVSCCPSKAIELEGYIDEEILAEIDGILS